MPTRPTAWSECVTQMQNRVARRSQDEHLLSWLCMALTSPVLRCAAPLFSLSSLTLHPLTGPALPLCFPFLLSPVLAHWLIVLGSFLFFCLPFHYRSHQSHHSCARKHLLSLSLVAVSLQFSLISSSFIPLFLASPGTVFFQPTLFHSPPPQLPTFPPNLALTSICLLISKCSPLPSVLSWCC